MEFNLYNDDCLVVMREMEDNSIDSIVTDPPYGLSFMGKKWDCDVPSVEIWQECLRVLKPGGHLLAFAGTRTQHRMCVNIEDAGFEIRDMLAWIYGSGFPKSLNISKGIDKKFGAEREVVGINEEYLSKNLAEIKRGVSNQSVYYQKCGATEKHAGYCNPLDGQYITSPSTDDAKNWDGWGTALKPALEPITLARKPLEEKTIVDNVLKYNTGGINIDESRIVTDDNLNGGAYSCSNNASKFPGEERSSKSAGMFDNSNTPDEEYKQPKGRFPANLLHDGSDEVEEIFPYTGKAGNVNKSKSISSSWKQSKNERDVFKITGDNGGSASRFFKKCEDITCQEENQNQLNVNIVENPLSLQDRVEDFVLELVAIKDSREDNLSKSMITPFMIEIQKVLKINSVKNIKMMMNSGIKCLQDLKHIITEKLKCNHVSNVEIQKLINTMMIIQNLMNIDGFVEVVTSNIMLKNMVLGEKVCRFKYCAKTSKKDRGENNNHPTVKPTDLMRYLVKLITPKDGVCLDPFMGSGSTGKACKLEDFNFIGIDLDSDYVELARNRIKNTITERKLF